MKLIYNITLRFYKIMILFGGLFNEKAALWITGRKGYWKILTESIRQNEKIIWIHAASVGEFEQGRPLIEELKKNHPQYRILLTFFSPSGYELRKNYDQADYIFYLPLDTAFNARKFLSIVRPEMAVFIKYEFWYHYLNQLNKNGIPVYLISGIFRSDQVFFRWYGRWFKKILQKFDFLFVQNETSLKLLQKVGISNVMITGDTRFDRVIKIVESNEEVAIVKKFKQDKLLIIGGSTWQPDEEILIRYFNEHKGQFKLLLAPHEIKQSHIQRIISSVNGKTALFTDTDQDTIQDCDVLIVNTIGQLSKIYRYADLAFIGGAFGKGLHNILEAAAYGIPVIFGPKYSKFQEAVDLIREGGAHSIVQYHDAADLMDMYQNNEAKRIKDGNSNRQFILHSLGSTKKIIEKLFLV